MKDFFLKRIREKGGFSCYHAHFDKSYLISPDTFIKSQHSLQEKWDLYREFKVSYTENDLLNRMSKCVSNMLSQDVKYIRTFLDADSIVGQKCIDAGVKLKEIYKDKVKIDLAIQPLEGLEDKKSRYNFIEACEKADYIGGLPDRDSSHRKHIETLFDLAVKLDKPIDIHVGQNNLPTEKETELVLDLIEEYDLEQKVNLVHCISLSCQDNEYIMYQAERMKDLNVSVIVCPSAAISMKQNHSVYTPTHNSIAPINILLEAGVEVKLGIDNISDLFMPLVDGDLWFETRLLMESTRIYDLEKIVNIIT